MRKEIFVVLSLVASACVIDKNAGDDTGGGGGGGGGSGGGAGGWTVMELLDDSADPNSVIYHKDEDRVVGIHYASADKGLVVTQGDGDRARGGAVFATTGGAVTKILFRGDGSQGASFDNFVTFTGIEPTPSGYIAMAHATEVIASKDGGATFTAEKNGNLIGIEPVLAFKVTSSGTTIVRHTGVVSTSASAPGASMTYTDVWAPTGVPPTPDPVPDTMCQGGPRATTVPATRASVYVSSDRNFIAYTSEPDTREPQICISTDGGKSFTPSKLTVPEDTDLQPSGVTFTSATNGITWYGSSTFGKYLKRTTDAGKTWTDVAFPAAIADHDIELPAVSFAPDGMHGWLAGYDYTDRRALLIATSDGGATWQRVDGVGDAVEQAEGGKLFAVFGLDASHVWIGGERGLLMHN